MAASVDDLNAQIKPLFPGLMGVRVTEATPEKIVAAVANALQLAAGAMIVAGPGLVSCA